MKTEDWAEMTMEERHSFIEFVKATDTETLQLELGAYGEKQRKIAKRHIASRAEKRKQARPIHSSHRTDIY